MENFNMKELSYTIIREKHNGENFIVATGEHIEEITNYFLSIKKTNPSRIYSLWDNVKKEKIEINIK